MGRAEALHFSERSLQALLETLDEQRVESTGTTARSASRADLTVHEGGRGADMVTGETVLNEVFDLIRLRLPFIGASDPARPYLAALAPALAEALGRPRAAVVPAEPLPD